MALDGIPNLDGNQPPAATPAPAWARAIAWLIVGGVAFAVGSCIVAGRSASTGTSAAAAVQRETDAGIARAIRLREAVKAGLREPASFQVASASLHVDGTVCITYRARNGFGGMAIDHIASTADGQVVAGQLAAAGCASPGARDITTSL